MSALALDADRPSSRGSGKPPPPCFAGLFSGMRDAPPLTESPLVAVCGLAGNAGTSTLAWLIARAAREHGAAPLLLCELDGAAGGLADISGASSPRSLGELASGIHGPGFPFVTLEDGLRLIATQACRVGVEDHQPALTDVMHTARSVHAATIVDCGPPGTPGTSIVLALASHVAWVVQAGPSAAKNVEAVLIDADPGSPPGCVRELVAVVARDASTARADLALRDAVAERCQRLVLVPHVKLPKAPLAGSRAGASALRCALEPILEFIGLDAR